MSKSTRQVPRIFISHSSKDTDFVKRLANDLCYVLDDDTAVWYDVLGLQGGDTWWPKIVDEIKTRNIFVLILSPDAMKSPWIDDELHIAWRRKNVKSRTRRLIIPILFRECKTVHDYLKDIQWIRFLSPETYQSAFNNLLKSLKVPFDERTNEFLRKLETLDSSFVRPVTPKATVDFNEKEREESLNLLGKYTAFYISQSRWDDVLKCVKEALPLAPNDPHWLHIEQEACTRIAKKENIFIPHDSSRASNRNNLRKSTSSSMNRAPHAARGRLQEASATTTVKFSQSLKKDISQSKQKKKADVNYLNNFAGFMTKFIRVNDKGFYVTCFFDVLIIPCLLGIWFSSWIIFLGSFIVSFFLLTIGPVTKNRKLATASVLGFSISWSFTGWFLGWQLGVFISLILALFARQTSRIDLRAIGIVITILFFIFGTCLHLVIALATQYLVKDKIKR